MIEHIFGILNFKFPILTSAHLCSMGTEVKIVLVYCILLDKKMSQIDFSMTCARRKMYRRRRTTTIYMLKLIFKLLNQIPFNKN